MTDGHDRREDLQVIQQIDDLNQQVKRLALSLAIYLAKAKSRSEELDRLEPEFIRLVNGTVRAVQELAALVDAARNLGPMVYDPPSGDCDGDLLEAKLRSILDLCERIMKSLASRMPA